MTRYLDPESSVEIFKQDHASDNGIAAEVSKAISDTFLPYIEQKAKEKGVHPEFCATYVAKVLIECSIIFLAGLHHIDIDIAAEISNEVLKKFQDILQERLDKGEL